MAADPTVAFNSSRPTVVSTPWWQSNPHCFAVKEWKRLRTVFRRCNRVLFESSAVALFVRVQHSSVFDSVCNSAISLKRSYRPGCESIVMYMYVVHFHSAGTERQLEPCLSPHCYQKACVTADRQGPQHDVSVYVSDNKLHHTAGTLWRRRWRRQRQWCVRVCVCARS